MSVVQYKKFYMFLLMILSMLFFTGRACFFDPLVAFAATEEPGEIALEISGEGVGKPISFTLDELKKMEQYQHIYSTINTYPTKKWYTARGIKLKELLELADFKTDTAQLIRFVGSDGYEITLTVKELLKDKRYYFPGLKENDPHDGSVPGSADGKLEVEAILALLSSEGGDDPADMDDRDALHFILGQRAVTEPTCALFLKYVCRIEVLNKAPEKWDTPRTNIPGVTVVPEGTMLELFNKLGDTDKIYYTTDGSTPTVNSPMYNWIANRWHSERAKDLKEVNSPLAINKDTVIKAITIGPGKEDSDVVTFAFSIDYSGQTADPTKVPGGPPAGIILDRQEINLQVGGAFLLEATVLPYNAADKRVTWSSSDTRVATVNNSGLVTVVGEGTAAITAATVVGNHQAVCLVNDPHRGEDPLLVPAAGVAPKEEPQEQEGPLEPEPEPAKQHPAKKEVENTAPVAISLSAGAPDEPPGEGPPALEGKKQHLAEKKDLQDIPAAVDSFSGPPGRRAGPGQVFEMSRSTVPFPLQEEQSNLSFYMLVIFLILFFTGLGKKYTEYTKEQ